MKQNNFLTGILSLAFVASACFVQAQAFHKGSFQVNLSEGWSSARYTTNDLATNTQQGTIHITGDRDPLSIEYGLSSHWGIGLSTGMDIYFINPSSFYGFGTNIDRIKSTSSEFTIDASYHFFVSEKTDVSAVLSLGASSVIMKGGLSDYTYQYTANGGMIRLGVHARYFMLKHIGALAMLSMYSTTDSPAQVKGNTVGNNYSTTICGTSLEFGLCYRFKK